MWTTALVVFLLVVLARPAWAQDDVTAASIAPQDCTLDCIRQGQTGCEYCRITRSDVREALGFNSIPAFGSCVPWPCFALLGEENPQICQHYVHPPTDVTVDFIHETNPTSDSVVVSWKPSYYGISFLRGFQVSLQALGGSTFTCQLLLFHRNLSLSASHAQRVYKSDPFTGLSLGSQFAVTVMALPVPEKWDRFYHSKIFSTRSCADKNGLEKCKKDWYPEHIEVQQEGTDITVTFNLAPPDLEITSYFSLCYANGVKKYTDIVPKSTKNQTHHTYQLKDLQEGTNYTCEIAANEVDAVRRTFGVQVVRIHKDSTLVVAPSLALVLPLCLTAVAALVLVLAAVTWRRSKHHMKKLDLKPDIIKQYEDDTACQEEVVSLPRSRLTPPRLLICYSSNDGAAHVKAVMQLGAFIQQHMATQVCLDTWESLSVAQEGAMAWHCRQIRDSDFVLVICSRGLGRKQPPPPPPPPPAEPEGDEGGVEEGRWLNFRSNAFSSDAAVQLVGEEVGRAKAGGRDLSKYMAAIFEYSEEADIPTELGLVPHYALTRDLPLLFSRLHGVALHRPGGYLKINHISEEGFAKLPAGAALQLAIYEAGKRHRSAEGTV